MTARNSRQSANSASGTRHKQILYCQNQFPVLTQTFVANEVRELLDRGLHVTVVSARRGDSESPADCDVLVIEEMPKASAVLSQIRLAFTNPRAYWRYLTDSLAAGRAGLPWSLYVPLIAERLQLGPDVHIHTHFATRAAVTARLLSSISGSARSVTTHAADIYGKNLALSTQLHGAAVATVTNYNRSFLAQQGYRDVQLIRCGVRILQDQYPQTLRHHQAGPNGQPVRIVSVGRLVPKKGHDVLLAAVERLVDDGWNVRCTIVGQGPEHAGLSAQVAAAGLSERVNLIGALPHSEILALLREADVFALACRRANDGDIDGLPVAFLEAAAFGVPVVGGDVAGVGEFLNGETGWAVSPDDADALAKVLSTVLEGGKEVERRRTNALYRVRTEFSLTAQADGVLQLFARAAKVPSNA